MDSVREGVVDTRRPYPPRATDIQPAKYVVHIDPYLWIYVLFLELVTLMVGKGFRMHMKRMK
jgi:hypothetical protein